MKRSIHFILAAGMIHASLASAQTALFKKTDAGAPRITLRRHINPVLSLAFSPDGATLYSGSNDEMLIAWDIKNRRMEPLAREQQPGDVRLLAVGSRGKKIMAGYESNEFFILHPADIRPIKKIYAPGETTLVIALSYDGETAATASNDSIDIWNVLRGQKTKSILKTKQAPFHASLSRNGEKLLLFFIEDQSLRLYDIQTKRETVLSRGAQHYIRAMAFSPDATLAVTGGYNGQIRVWDLRAEKQLLSWKGHIDTIRAIAFAPDGDSFYSGGTDSILKNWDIKTGLLQKTWRGHGSDIRAIAVSPAGDIIATGGEDYTVRIWDRTGKAHASQTAPTPQSEIDLGRFLFFDQRLSGDYSINCAGCHNPKQAFTDGRALSLGFPPHTLYFRNTPTLLDIKEENNLCWDGRFPFTDISSLMRDHISEAHFMNTDGRLLLERIRQVPVYTEAFTRLYGEEPTYDKILHALSAFVLSLQTVNSPYDRMIRGETKTLSPAAQRGFRLFKGSAGCASCHSGPNFTDNAFHNRSVPENPEILDLSFRRVSFRRFFKHFGVKDYATLDKDAGLYAVTRKKEDLGKFKTPSLKNVALTPPYMHNGMLATLEEAVAFETPTLHSSQRRDIVAFLESLSGEMPQVMPAAPPPDGLRSKKEPPPLPMTPAPADSRSFYAEDFPALALLPPVPVPQDNPITKEKVELGRMLFFEDLTAGGNGETYCVVCHEPTLGWSEHTAISRGATGSLHWRNSQTLLNSAYFEQLHWDGSKSSLEEQTRAAIVSNIASNGDPSMVEERLAEIPDYIEVFKKVFGVDRPHFEGVVKAVSAFLRAVPISSGAPFDKYLQGEMSAISESAKRGMAIFHGKARCIQCHNGPLASNQNFYALGVPQNPLFDEVPLLQVTLRYIYTVKGVSENFYNTTDSDPGLYFTTKNTKDIGKFRVPSLRGIAHTAPYMHNGVFRSLKEVVDFYDKGGGSAVNKTPLLYPLHLEDSEKSDLIAFLKTMSGTLPSARDFSKHMEKYKGERYYREPPR